MKNPNVPTGHVLVRAPYTSEQLLMLLDEGPPTPSGGFGGFGTIAVPRNEPIRYYEGRPEEGLSVDVILLKGNQTVAQQIRTLQSIGKAAGTRRPRQVEILGQLPPLDLDRWVIDNVSWGESFYNEQNFLIRQALTIELGEPPDVDAVDVSSGGRSRYRKRNGKRAKKATAALLAGETLQMFCARVLGNPSRWQEVAKLQKPVIKDPRRPDRVGKKTVKGRRLRLPRD